jgi:hypothetical protein
MDPLRIWWEAAAEVESDLAADVAAEAYDVFVAEAARVHLVDRRGHVRVQLCSGASLAGEVLDGDEVAGHLGLREESGAVSLVCVAAIVCLRGSRVALRPVDPEDGRPGGLPVGPGTSIGSWLRGVGEEGAVIRVALADGTVLAGTVVLVAADHVELVELGSADRVAVPFGAVEYWMIPAGERGASVVLPG